MLKLQLVKVELLKPSTPQNCILSYSLTQTATFQANHTILTLSVKAIFKAMTNMVLGTRFSGVRTFHLLWEVFQQEREFWG